MYSVHGAMEDDIIVLAGTSPKFSKPPPSGTGDNGFVILSSQIDICCTAYINMYTQAQCIMTRVYTQK